MMLDGKTKGIPGGVAPFPLSEIAAKGWNLLGPQVLHRQYCHRWWPVLPLQLSGWEPFNPPCVFHQPGV